MNCLRMWKYLPPPSLFEECHVERRDEVDFHFHFASGVLLCGSIDILVLIAGGQCLVVDELHAAPPDVLGDDPQCVMIRIRFQDAQ